MNFTGKRLRGGAVRVFAAAAAITIALATWYLTGSAAAYDGPIQTGVGGMPPAQAGGSPEANLPYLFAVYIITWAAFFGYVFYVSRRQREMQGEIEALKHALEERDVQPVE